MSLSHGILINDHNHNGFTFKQYHDIWDLKTDANELLSSWLYTDVYWWNKMWFVCPSYFWNATPFHRIWNWIIYPLFTLWMANTIWTISTPSFVLELPPWSASISVPKALTYFYNLIIAILVREQFRDALGQGLQWIPHWN